MSSIDMNDREVVIHLRKWIKKKHGIFAWPTDGCGYEQHMRFVNYRNKYWQKYYLDEKGTFNQFILGYADKLDKQEVGGYNEG